MCYLYVFDFGFLLMLLLQVLIKGRQFFNILQKQPNLRHQTGQGHVYWLENPSGAYVSCEQDYLKLTGAVWWISS